MPRDWLVGLGGVVGGVLLAVARGWLTKAAEALGRWLQSSFSGSRLLHGRALRKYRATTLAEQETFRPAFDPRIRLSMRDVYVPLHVSAQATAATGPATGEAVEAYQAVRATRCAVVTGPPGSGKSMSAIPRWRPRSRRPRRPSACRR
ncbi:hypothetical protein [Frankia sp. QA3]|uniref:hypothetical protein n=1 Tax=Frankia sp. QA3 TaxID=710111 RepID=UPI000269C1C9|nr:hypothetical protein [Frankia sp. QA3]EIV93018.1 hypothetical protein FraQA3DRAFT_2693 [Frankia sp. QA3]